MTNIQIRDARDNARYFLDNELVDIYGKQIGAFGLAVYNVLARYANHNSQECYPSYKTIGDALDISRNAVIAAIKKIEDAGLISIEKRISAEKGKPTTSSIYTLLAIKKALVEKDHPGTSEVPGNTSQELPSPLEVPGLVPEKDHPGTSEVPELNVFKRTNLNKGGIARPPKSESVLIEEYYLKQTTGSIGFMNSLQRELIGELVEKGFTLERCKPGIDSTIAEMNAKSKSVGSFKICIPAIIQLDPAKVKPVLLNFPQPGQPRPKTQAEIDNEKDMARWQAKRKAQMDQWHMTQPQPQQPQTATAQA